MNASLPSPSSSRHSREGIALIIVLGLLAVLVILGVSFSISMRTERMATRSFVDVVKARQVVHAAVNRVLDQEVNDFLDGSVYPPLDVFTDNIPGGDGVKVLGDRTTTSPIVFLPGIFRTLAFAVEDQVSWQELRDPVNNQLYGEFAFLAVNCSGLLDANVVDGLSRALGEDPREIELNPDLLSELNPPGANNLPAYRSEFGKFESVSELYYLLSTTDFEGQIPAPNNIRPLKQNVNEFGPWADNLFVYSRYPSGFADIGLAAAETAFIGGDPATNWNLADIKQKLQDLQQPNLIPDVDDFIAAMYDYANKDYEPYGTTVDDKFKRFSSKPVPMINEVIVSNSFQLVDNLGQQVLVHRTYVTIETWFPFPPDSDNTPFSVVLSQPPVITAPPFTGPVQFESGPLPASFQPNAGNGYDLTTFVFAQTLDVNGQGQPQYTAGGVFRSRVQLNGDVQVVYEQPPRVVDVVFGPWGPGDFFLSGSRPNLALGNPPVSIIALSRAVNDPRINWDPSNSDHWATGNATPTPKTRNGVISAKNNKTDEFDFMYARRGPIRSVGELGFLLYDASKPWQTVRLLGENPVTSAKVIDRLTTFTNEVRRGLVNINTRQTNVLASTLIDMPIDRYPGQGSTTLFAPLAAQGLAASIVNDIIANGSVTNLSDLSARVNIGPIDTALGSAGDKFRRESLIRNTAGLWGTRNQVYTFFVTGRVFSDQYDPAIHDKASRTNFVVGEQQAIAVVWRDPFETTDTVGNTTHKSFVQFFHWFAGAFQ